MTTARRTQQERRDQAEAALLNAAAELVVEEGVHSLTLARLLVGIWKPLNGSVRLEVADTGLGMSEETYDRIYAKHHPDYMNEARDATRRRS